MKIAYIHYHLKRGGVTTVLKEQVKAVMDRCEVIVLTGEPSATSFPVETVHIPGLGYFNGSFSDDLFRPEIVAKSVIDTIMLRFNGKCDILHVHNPILAKNRNFLKILKLLQKNGIKLFLQIHDFAEDGRPLSYFADEKYLSDCHYGVINSRDYQILLNAGLTEKGLHILPNPVKPFDSGYPRAGFDNMALYPVRAIRRKNIGEAILLSVFFKNKETLSITLPPNSAEDIKSYNGWKEFVKENALNVEFDAGLKNDFSKLVTDSKFVITTSITEGFGFTYLETWSADKILCGRKLPGICDSFEKEGICLDHLYTKILVPVKWIGRKRLYDRWKKSLLRSFAMYNHRTDEKSIVKLFEKIIKDDSLDYGLLDERFQKEIISRVISSKEDNMLLVQKNPFIVISDDLPDKKQLIQINKKAVKEKYNNTVYKKRLLNIYSKVKNDSVFQSINKDKLLSEFFNPENFSLLKWGGYAG